MDKPLPAREFLNAAFLRIWNEAWYPTLDENMAHPIRQKIIVSLARRIEAGQLPLRPENPAKHQEKPGRSYRSAPLAVDLKRLAAGDKDDD